MKWFILIIAITTVACAPVNETESLKNNDESVTPKEQVQPQRSRNSRRLDESPDSDIMRISVQMLNDEVDKIVNKKEFRAIKDLDSVELRVADDPVIQIRNRPQYQEINRRSKNVDSTRSTTTSTTTESSTTEERSSKETSTAPSTSSTWFNWFQTKSTTESAALEKSTTPASVSSSSSSSTTESESSSVEASSTPSTSTTWFNWFQTKSTTETPTQDEISSTTPAKEVTTKKIASRTRTKAPTAGAVEHKKQKVDENTKAKVVKDSVAIDKDVESRVDEPTEEKRGRSYKHVKITNSDSKMDESGKFRYSYETDHGVVVGQEGELRAMREDQMGEAVRGGFSYVDEAGNKISLSYTADENGYRPVGAHLPTPPPIPEAIARALAHLATKKPTVDEWNTGESNEEHLEKMLLNNPRKQRKLKEKSEKSEKKPQKPETKKPRGRPLPVDDEDIDDAETKSD